MKTIGLVDYYISEWHANNYPGWIREINAETDNDFEVKYVWAELDISPVDGKSTDQWCQEFGAERCDSIEELCEKSDYILILSPSNPEKHLQYAQKVFPYGKNTYIDKTFAPDTKTAEEIFRLGNQTGTRFFSSSALRYASELDDMDQPLAMITFGNGSNLDEYIIHQIEMAVKVMAEAPIRVKVEKQARQFICTVEFQHDKRATMIYSPSLPFMAIASPPTGKHVFRQISSDYFRLLIKDILRFYESGVSSFDPAQTLAVMQIREAIMKAKEALGQWISVARQD